MERLFGTDGVRGIANVTMGCEKALRIGQAAAAVFARGTADSAKILIGKDTRRSSDMLESALAAGLCSIGADVYLLGVVPTPAVAYLTALEGADAGVMISASHNPAQHNGIKLFSGNGTKLPDETEDEIAQMVFAKAIPPAQPHRIGRIYEHRAAVERYIEYLLQAAAVPAHSPLRIAIDCANGSAYETARRLFGKLQADTHFLHCTPDGDNINANCGSTHPEGLCRYVAENGCDIGFAFDGDADRCLAVDERGELLNGDRILGLLALDQKERGHLPNGIVSTVMGNPGLVRFCERHEIPIETTPVGDRYVWERMQQHGHTLGGEPSGHTIFADLLPTGDGQLTALRFLGAFLRAKQRGVSSLHEWAAQVPIDPQAERSIAVTAEQKARLKTDDGLPRLLEQLTQALGQSGRILVRPSGTESLIRILAQGNDPQKLESIAERIATHIRSV